MSHHIRKYFNELESFRWMIFLTVIFTGFVLWVFRLMILFGIFHNPHGNFWFTDFRHYYLAAENYLEGKDIYQNTGFYYPPIAVIFFLVFTFLPLSLASIIFTFINGIIILIVLYFIFKILLIHKIRLKKIEKLTIFLFLFTFYPIGVSITHGQVDLIILLFIVIFYYYFTYKKNFTFSALALVTASIFKIWPLFLSAVELFLHGKRDLIKKCLIMSAGVVIATLVIFGIETTGNFIQSLSNFQSYKIYSYEEIEKEYTKVLDKNISLFNVMSKFLAILDLSKQIYILYIIKLLILIFFIYICLSKVKKIRNTVEGNFLIMNFTISTIFIVANTIWVHYFTYTLFSIIFYIYIYKTNILERFLLFFIILLISFQQYMVYGSMLLGGLIALCTYIFPPTSLANIFYFILSTYSILKREFGRAS